MIIKFCYNIIMNDIIIKNIKHYKCFEQTVSKWLYDEWGLKGSQKYWDDWVKFSQNENSTFQTYVVLKNNQLIATYGIMPCDLQSRQDLTPWIGNLYIPKEHRKLSLELMPYIFKHSEDEFRKLKLKKVYLFTPHKPIVFKKFGYKFIEFSTDYDGSKISLLEKDIL